MRNMMRYKSLFFVMAVVGIVVSLVIMLCEWTIHVRGDSLRKCCYPKNTPKVGRAYYHNKGSLEVIQVVPNGVRVAISKDFVPELLKKSPTSIIHHGKNDIIAPYSMDEVCERLDNECDLLKKVLANNALFIETTRPYVEGELLDEGYYEFIGTFTYKNVVGEFTTARRFKAHKCKMFFFGSIFDNDMDDY